MLTKMDYAKIFQKERLNDYPEVTEFERFLGYAINKEKLENAAQILACPFKANPPNWQHGRIIYAAACARMESDREGCFLDIGTAKGFSACIMSWAIEDEESQDIVVSLDVIDPCAAITRNSVAELDGLKTLAQFIDPFRARDVQMHFFCARSTEWLKNHKERIAFAFVDGKHTYDTVCEEIFCINRLQQRNDVIVFDDLQIEPVARAVLQLHGYSRYVINAGQRKYLYAVKK